MEPIRAATAPHGLFEEIEREATGRLRKATFGISRLAREDRVGGMAAYLFERYRPTLPLMHLISTDHVPSRHRGAAATAGHPPAPSVVPRTAA